MVTETAVRWIFLCVMFITFISAPLVAEAQAPAGESVTPQKQPIIGHQYSCSAQIGTDEYSLAGNIILDTSGVRRIFSASAAAPHGERDELFYNQKRPASSSQYDSHIHWALNWGARERYEFTKDGVPITFEDGRLSLSFINWRTLPPKIAMVIEYKDQTDFPYQDRLVSFAERSLGLKTGAQFELAIVTALLFDGPDEKLKWSVWKAPIRESMTDASEYGRGELDMKPIRVVEKDFAALRAKLLYMQADYRNRCKKEQFNY